MFTFPILLIFLFVYSVRTHYVFVFSVEAHLQEYVREYGLVVTMVLEVVVFGSEDAPSSVTILE